MSMLNRPSLSFCIPTYNRVESVIRSVTAILSIPDKDIEIVVLDNGSTDNTLDSLRLIRDERLIVYENGKNKGALYNMVNVLNKGKGLFLVYLTDQDAINSKEIAKFKNFLLDQKRLAGGYCEFNSKSKIDFELFDKGYEAIRKIGYLSRHPTGYFFNRKMMKAVNYIDKFSDYSFVDLFPLEFVLAELGEVGKGGVYYRPIFTPETGKKVETTKSATTRGSSKNAFFSPKARLKMALNFTKHIDTLNIECNNKKKMIVVVFVQGLFLATFGYRSILNNSKLCKHYDINKRSLNVIDLTRIGYNFYLDFCQNSKSLNINRVEFEFKIAFNFLIYSYFKLKNKWFI
jgi:glycosyltransferase involved in cell wall biosynthesis